MKFNLYLVSLTSISAIIAFICSYFFDLTMNHAEQYLALISSIFLDGLFGIIAGVKREGFKTHKAIKILRTSFYWVIILTTILIIQKGFEHLDWLSEIIIIPFIAFQMVSALKNASMCGLVKINHINYILDRIDLHKGIRESEPEINQHTKKIRKSKKSLEK